MRRYVFYYGRRDVYGEKRKDMTMKKSKFTILVLIVMLMGVAVFGVACGSKKSKNGPEVGQYCCFAGETEYTLTLSNGKKFSYSIQGTEKSGKYTVSGNSLTLTHSDANDGTLSARLQGNTLILTYDGAEMVFYKKINFTVSFDTKGGSAVSAVTVQNGKTVQRPDDPQRAGYAFVAWYEDADCTQTVYDFSSAVTGNITLYAKWIDGATDPASEHTVSFDLCYTGAAPIESMRTVGGKLYNVPTPQREGYTFAGWWISQYGDKDKLSYKFSEGRTLVEEDTTLYALWQSTAITNKLAMPQPDIQADLISWDSVANADRYRIEVYGPTGFKTVDEQIPSTSRQVKFSESPAGEYTVKVTAIAANPANNSDAAERHYINKGLKKVAAFRVEDGVLIFGAVEHADKYIISVDCGDKNHKHTNVDNGKRTTYPFGYCAMQEGGIVFTVRAVASGYAPSVSRFVYGKGLYAVQNLAYDADTQVLSWSAVDGITNYRVILQCENADHTHALSLNNGLQTSICLKEYDLCDADTTVRVYAEINGYRAGEEAELTFTKPCLATPTDVRIIGDTLSWGKVAGATGYTVKINETEVATTDGEEQTSLDLSTVSFDWDGADYTLSLRANGAHASLWSDPIDIRYYAMYATLDYLHGVISWRHVVGALYYEVKVNDGTPVKVENGANFAEIAWTKAGDNTVSVRFNDGEKDSEWATKTVFAHTVTYDANGGVADESVQYKATGDRMNGETVRMPEAEKEGYTFRAWYNTRRGPDANGAAYLDDYFQGEKDITLYAYYAPKSYTVTLFYHDGRVPDGTEKVTVLFDTPFTLPVPAGSGEDTSFGGWFGAEGGRGLQYTDEVGASIFGWPRPEDVQLHAFWRDLVLNYTETTFEGQTVYEVTKGDRIYGQTEIFVPETYKGSPVTIGPNAFYGCTSIRKISIPDSILSISEVSPFGGCTSLQEIEIRHVEDNTDIRYWAQGGVLYDSGRKDDRGSSQLIFVPLLYAGDYEIPADKNVTAIKANAFENVRGLTGITIPASVTSVGSQAFKGCTSLQNVTFSAPAGNVAAQELTVYDWAFEGCTSLASITLPARLKIIPLTRCKINDYTYTEYDYEDFGGADFITDTTSRYDNTEITDAFKGCTSLAEINVEVGNAYYASADGILYDKSGKTLLYCPSARTKPVQLDGTVTKIGDGAFYGSKAVFVLEVPSNVAEIGELAFYKSNIHTLSFSGGILPDPLKVGKCAFACTDIATMQFADNSNVTEIDDLAFYDCKKLTQLNLPASLQKIGFRAFYRCAALTSVTVADSEDESASLTFAEEVFNYCAKLQSITLPKQAKNLPGFVGCTELTNIDISDGSRYLTVVDGAVFDKAGTTLFYFPTGATEYTVPDSVTTIAEGVFRENTTLQSITIGKNVTRIGKNAFYACTALTSVTFADGGSADLTIDDRAFYGCSAIRSLALPARLLSIGDFAFYKVGQLTALTFGDGSRLVGIGESAFAYTGADNVRIPKGVTVLSAEAFANSPVKRVTFEEGSILTTIEFQAFYNSALTYFAVPNTVTTIAPQAFYGNASLATVVFAAGGTQPLTVGLPDGVHKENGYLLYGETFARCTSLTSVALPGRTTELGYATFYGCTNLKTATFAGEGEESMLKFIPDRAFAQTGLTSVIIPKSVRNCEVIKTSTSSTLGVYHAAAVSEGAFANCTALQTATFESGNTNPVTIDKGAFSGCTALTRVVLPANITSYTDETGAQLDTFFTNSSIFDGCTALQALEIDEANEKYKAYEGIIYNSDFSAVAVCPPGIKSAYIHDNVKALTSATFSSCKSLTYISLPAPLANLANSLKSSGRTIDIRVDGQDDVVKLPNGVLCAADSAGNPVTVLYVPDTLTGTFEIPKTVTRIAELAFNETKLTAVTFEESDNADLGDLYIDSSAFLLGEITTVALPARLKYIGANAFIRCANLSTVTFDANCRLDEIGNAAFFGCAALTSIEIPASVREIPAAENASFTLFGGCSSLTDVTFAAGSRLQTIGSYAFAGSKMQNLTIPASVTLIGAHAFDGAADLASVTFAASSACETIGAYAFNGCKALSSIRIPASVKTVAERAFSGCAALASVTVGDNSALQTIGNAAFSGCAVLASFAIPSAVTSIGDEAFADCARITFVDIPFGVTTLGRAVFSGCTSLAVVGNIDHVLAFGESCFARTAIESFTLPSGLTEISAYLFERCTKLTAIEIPDSVHTIGENAFIGCVSLTDVKLPTNALFTEIPDYLFSGCRKLTQITVPNTVKTIGSYAFASTGITEFNVPDSVIAIKSGVFSSCTSLKRITGLRYVTQISSMRDGSPFEGCVKLEEIELPVSAAYTTVSSALLQNCTALTHIKIPSNVQRIESYAFAGCTSLESIEFEEGVSYIGVNAFYNCRKLTSVTFPSSLRTIGAGAFGACYGLKTAEFNEGLLTIGHSAFSGCTQLTEIALPSSLAELGSYAFENCLSVTGTVAIPANLESIGYNPFVGSSVTGFTVANNAIVYVKDNALVLRGGAEDGDLLLAFPKTVAGSYTVASGSKIGPRAFADSSLTEIVLEAGVALTYDEDASSPNGIRYSGNTFDGSEIARVIIKRGSTNFVRVCSAGFAGMNITDGIYFMGSEAEWSAWVDTAVSTMSNRNLFDSTRYYYSETYKEGAWHYAGDGISFWTEADLQPVTYTLRLNNGEADKTVEAVYLTTDLLPAVQREDYIFDGWYDNAQFTGKAVKFPYFTGNNATLYVKWVYVYDCDGTNKERAYRITTDEVYEKSINTKDTWFAFTLSEETRLKISVQSTSSIICTLYDSDDMQTDSNNGGFIVVKNFAADTYYLNVNVFFGNDPVSVRVEKVPLTEGSTKDRAIELTLAEPYERAFDAGEYWFKLDPDGDVMLNMSAAGASVSYVLYNGKDVAVQGGSLPASSVELESGSYYLKVYTSGSLSGFTLRIAPQPGSSMGSAAEAQLGQSYTVQTSGTYWFKFTPDYSAKVTVSASSYLSGSALYAYVYDENGTLLKESGYTYISSLSLTSVFVEHKTYYVAIRPLTGAAITVAFAAEQIDTPEGLSKDTAIEVDLSQSFTSRVYADLVPVWFTFTLADENDIHVSFTDTGYDDIVYVIMDESGNAVANGRFDWGESSFETTQNLQAGKYYLLVNLWGSSDDDFTVNIAKL